MSVETVKIVRTNAVSNMLRSLARNRAKEVMKTKGMVNICRKNRRGDSFFSENWRQFAFPTVIKKGAKSK